MIDGKRTVREIALEIPSATRVLEQRHIDYCCGGARTLAEACELAHVSLSELIAEIEASAKIGAASMNGGWSDAPLSKLIDHLVTTHHVFTRAELARLEPIAVKVRRVHGANHPELARVESLFLALKDDLDPHLYKEEAVLFPLVLAGEPVDGPIDVMTLEHDAVGGLLRQLRAVTHDYELPADACTSYRLLYTGLEALERDLHEHIHLENNVLFPRALASLAT